MTDKTDDHILSDLGEMESDEDFVFPPEERRLVTQPLDLSVHSLVEQWNQDSLILPPIQREYVWDNGKASRLIESLILKIPIPVLYFAETRDAKCEIIDGHQRVQSIVRYMDNEFGLSGLAVLREYRGMRYHHLPDREKRFLRMRTLRIILISIDSYPNMNFEIFERLNTGAIVLNAQELRNSLYRGRFNDLLGLLVRDERFRGLIGTKMPRRRMVDQEILLRFFAMSDRLNAYKTPLKRFLNEFMNDARDFDEGHVGTFKDRFDTTVSRIKQYLGVTAFRVVDNAGSPAESSVNRALVEAQMLSFLWVADDGLPPDRQVVRQQIALLFADESFMDSIQRATGDKARTLKRIRETVSALRASGASDLNETEDSQAQAFAVRPGHAKRCRGPARAG